jgi:glycosyltransferase involved in cell wall biosynthesis
MQVVLSTIGKFHTFDLARELHAHGALQAIFTGYPRFKLPSEQLPADVIHTFPWVHAPYMGFRYRRFLGKRANQLWEYLDKITLDRYVSARMQECDVFVGLSGSALLSGQAAQARGAKYVCDRGSAHIRTQDQLLREEYALWGVEFAGIDPRVIDLEEAEYAASDVITIPSAFSLQSFIQQGVSIKKLRRLPYGVNLERFHCTAAPDVRRFDVLYVGAMTLQKGVQYLLQAFTRLRHPAKSLTFAGAPNPEFVSLMRQHSLWPHDAKVLGHVPQHRLKDVMSRSHVLVLPSIQDGFGMVQAQAMACGCPVVSTEHTGAADLFYDGREGFIVPIRQPDSLADRLQRLADDPALRSRMSAAAVVRVKQLGGWRDYGNQALSIFESLTASGLSADGWCKS